LIAVTLLEHSEFQPVVGVYLFQSISILLALLWHFFCRML